MVSASRRAMLDSQYQTTHPAALQAKTTRTVHVIVDSTKALAQKYGMGVQFTGRDGNEQAHMSTLLWQDRWRVQGHFSSQSHRHTRPGDCHLNGTVGARLLSHPNALSVSIVQVDSADATCAKLWAFQWKHTWHPWQLQVWRRRGNAE